MVKFQSTLPVRGATLPDRAGPRADQFQSTLPVRGATAVETQWSSHIPISIHAPREGSDWWAPPGTTSRSDFNPRSP